MLRFRRARRAASQDGISVLKEEETSVLSCFLLCKDTARGGQLQARRSLTGKLHLDLGLLKLQN